MPIKKPFLDIDLILKTIPIEDRQKVADLGCGKFGYFVFTTAHLVGRSGIVYAVDIIKTHLDEIAKRAKTDNLGQIQTVWSNLEIFKATKIESNSLDTVLLANTLNQSEKRADILREAVRLLKPKGKVVIVEWKNLSLPFGPQPEKRVKKESIIDAAPKLSLKLEKEFVAGEYHYGLIFTKV